LGDPADIDNALVRERIDIHESLAIFRVAPAEGVVPSFEPGQFTTLGLGRGDNSAASLTKRALSIASSPRERGHFEFYVRRVAGGEFTPELFRLRPGAGLWLDPRVHGQFTLEPVPRGSDVLMVATGTGVAPFVSMVRTYLGSGRWRRCVLLESAQTVPDLGYRAELERLARESPDFSYHPTLTREPTGSAWRGLRGRVQESLSPDAFQRLTQEPLVPTRWQVMLCGNPEMIGSVTALLSDLGFRRRHRREPGQIHTERYW
jgi:ferredoxin--NADP+ reductase